MVVHGPYFDIGNDKKAERPKEIAQPKYRIFKNGFKSLIYSLDLSLILLVFFSVLKSGSSTVVSRRKQ